MSYTPSDRLLAQLPYRSSGARGVQHFKYGQADYQEFRLLLKDLVEKQKPMTVRQVFYRAVVHNYVEKTEKGYGFIQKNLNDMRWNGTLPFEWIIDTSRQVRGSQGWNETVQEFMDGKMESLPYGYSIDLLADHDFSIQVWLEKEALAGVVYPNCMKWDVPLYCARGYASLSFLYEAAQDLERKDRPAHIFYFGDYDPSGQDAIETVRANLPALAPKTAKHGIQLQIVAVTPDDIEELNLPTRPTKGSDTRAGTFGRDRESVELDAIEPDTLREMVNDVMESCFPPGALEANKAQQEADREQIRQWIQEHWQP
jgi:hypothetical protein